ncbi:MAG: ABC transporter permease [Planctomycetales bacterium]
MTNPEPVIEAEESEVSKRSRANDQWSIVRREFCRHKMAVTATFVVVFLLTVSVFAPFLANGSPIYYRGYNRFLYAEASRTLRTIALRLVTTDKDPKAPSLADNLKGMEAQVRIMSSMISAADAATLRTELDKVSGLARSKSPDLGAAVPAFRTLLRDKYDSGKISLVMQNHWPVIANLHWSEILFMVMTVAFLTLPVWNRFLPERRSAVAISPATWCRFLILCVLPVAVSLTWWISTPFSLDRTKYRDGVAATATADKLASAPVVYERAIWPLIPYDLDGNDLDHKFAAPSALHWLGTDDVGRDVMSRMIWGGRVSLSVGIVAALINLIIGVTVGAIAGYFRGTWDLIISRLIEIVICFPSFFLILTIVAFLGPSIFNIMIVIGLIGWTGIAQLIRGEFLRLGEQEFILAARALGYSSARIIFLHVLPNAMAPVLVTVTFDIAGAILTESGLSFLGLGITLPKPSWGGILSSGREAVRQAPWLIYFPGLVIFITITSYNLIGETLRDASDPRLRGRR